MVEVSSALVGFEVVEQLADAAPEGVDRALLGLAQECLQLAKTCSIGLRSGEYGGR